MCSVISFEFTYIVGDAVVYAYVCCSYVVMSCARRARSSAWEFRSVAVDTISV